jgi:predicted nucleotidyltransferase
MASPPNAAFLPANLPANVDRALTDFVSAAKTAFGDRLSSVVLFGSGAEGRLRATSDVNVILILSAFIADDVDCIVPALNVARAAIRLAPMFLLASEIPVAMECFAQKFADIGRRRRVLYGPDPFAGLAVPRGAEIFRLRQVLLNLTIRLRESYAERAGNPERIAALLAETAGPLRTCAAALLELETGTYHAPKEALQLIVQSSGKPEWLDALTRISEVRERHKSPTEKLVPALFAIFEISEHMRGRAEKLHESI